MLKALLIGLKDLQVAFRDKAALVLMLAAPFAIAMGLGFVTGAFSGGDGDSGIRDIPIVIVNQDDGAIADNILEQFQTDEQLTTLFAVSTRSTLEEAESLINDEDYAAALVIPAGFSEAVANGDDSLDPLRLFTNPGRPISGSLTDAVVSGFISAVETSTIATGVTIEQLVATQRVQPQEIAALVDMLAAPSDAPAPIVVNVVSAENEPEADFNPLALLVPSMALFFLMYTVSIGGRSILQERTEGTLSRMLTTPTNSAQILFGKILGIFLTGAAQVGLLVIGSTLLFGLEWGSIAGLIVIILAAALAATGYGVLFAAVAKTPQQVASIGGAIMLLFGILGGTFVSIESGFLTLASKITPNAWAMEGFRALSAGGSFADVVTPTIALLVLFAVLASIAALTFRRQATV